MPKTQREIPGWKPLAGHTSRLQLFNETLDGIDDPLQKAILRTELPAIWVRPAETSRKWIFFHPSLSKDVILKVFQLLGDKTVTSRRASGLVESMDNVIYGLLHCHGVPSNQWPERRKGCKPR
jgi:hypothetical protein